MNTNPQEMSQTEYFTYLETKWFQTEWMMKKHLKRLLLQNVSQSCLIGKIQWAWGARRAKLLMQITS